MKRVPAVLGLCTLLLPIAALADNVYLVNEFGSVTLTNAGIVSRGSELMRFNGVTAPPGHSLGSVSFSTGALIQGSILGGGVFSSTGSSFVVIGSGKYGEPKGTIFSGSFIGPIAWVLVSRTGNNYVFDLLGSLKGMLYTGRSVTGATMQTIYVNQNQWNHNQRGSIGFGRAKFGPELRAGPESGTLGLFATGLIVLAGTILPKFVFSRRARSGLDH
ncbi:MAG TPA: hypothetical protein VKD23_15540 [Terriglobales bacterium]|nr:hypothetical protein [Terriglobales bacterium]